MSPINIPEIERKARQMRAEEIQRIHGLVAARMGLYGRLMAATALSGLAAIGETLRPLFSWTPTPGSAQGAPKPRGPSLLVRLNAAARALFSWNPQAHRS